VLLVDVASMPKAHHDDQEHVVFDRLDDLVIGDPDAKAWPAPNSPCSGRPWISGKQRDYALDATTNLRVELAQGAGCRRTKRYAILAHFQPRSALTCSHGMFGASSAIAASKAATSSASSKAVISFS